MLKISQYTYFANLSNGDSCAYNSLKGLSSICVFKGINKDTAQNCIQNMNYNAHSSIVECLSEKGHLVDSSINETAICNMKLAEMIFSKYLYLVIYVTEGCNFRCEYCYQNHETRKLDITTAEGIVKLIKREMFKYQGVKLSWFGGEPLLELPLIERISHEVKKLCLQMRKPFWAEITTNGYLLSIKNLERLLACNIYDYSVTIDGTKELHDQYRHTVDGKSSYDRIIANLIAIRDSINRNSLSIQIRTNITKESLKSLNEFYLELDQLFGNDKRFSLLIRPVYNWGGESVVNMESNLLNDSEMVQIYEQIADLNLSLKFWGNLSELEFGGRMCHACYRNRWTIGVNGALSKCDVCTPELEVGQLIEGKLVTKPIVDCWSNIVFERKPVCANCSLGGICPGGICPKNMITKGYNDCMFDHGVDELLQLAVKTVSEEKQICTLSLV